MNKRSDKVGDATKHIDITFGTGSLICHDILPESGTDTSRVGALNLLQNPLVLRYTLQGFILRHDCCVSALTAASAEGLHVSVSSGLCGTNHSCDDSSVGSPFPQSSTTLTVVTVTVVSAEPYPSTTGWGGLSESIFDDIIDHNSILIYIHTLFIF